MHAKQPIPHKCGQCGTEFGHDPAELVAGITVCSLACGNALSRRELARAQGWLRLIKRKSRGAAGDYAGIALNSNQIAWEKAKRR